MSKKPANSGQSWEPQDLRALRQLVRENTPTRVIALKLGRTPSSVYQKARIEGVSLKPVNQSPYNRRKGR
jgi:hypothetical protein